MNIIEKIKSGFKTTEFWGKTVVQIIAAIAWIRGQISPEDAAIIMSALEIVYNLVRGLIKMKQAAKE